MRIYSLIALLVLPLLLRSCQVNLEKKNVVVRVNEEMEFTPASFAEEGRVLMDGSVVIKRQGGYKGVLAIGDRRYSRHEKSMYEIITGIETNGDGKIREAAFNIPKENVILTLSS